jgi:hypothetical protein
MFADQIHAKIFDELKVRDHCFQRRRQVKTVGPVSLVKRAEPKHKLAVQQLP